MSVWDSLPRELRLKGDKVRREEGDAKEVIEYLVQQLAQARKAPAFTTASPVPALNGKRFLISQIVPLRKQVNLVISKTGWTSVAAADSQQVLGQGDFSTYNVFLHLPLLKRSAKVSSYMVLTKLGGSAQCMVFGAPESESSELVKVLKQVTKYSAVDLALNNCVAPAYVGASEGYLYFLQDFLFYGFRKPLMLVMLAEIESISFTMVTSRTFSIVVKLLDDSVSEFEKIDHKHYNMILEFINKHNLNDESLAEERRAKRQRTTPSALEAAAEEAKEEEDEAEDDEDDEEEDEDFESGEE